MTKRRCRRCNWHLERTADEKRGRFSFYVTCGSKLKQAVYVVKSAEMILRLAPRAPSAVTPRLLDALEQRSPFEGTKRHLKHVDNSKPGIMAQLRHDGRLLYELVEGHHRAENHRRDRTLWTCYLLTVEESYAILCPHH